MISKILWDIHSHNAKKFYINNNTKYDSTLEEYGYITGKLDKKSTDLLMNIFNSCEKIKFDPFDFDSDYVYEPRKIFMMIWLELIITTSQVNFLKSYQVY